MKIPKPLLFLFAAVLALGAFTPTHARAQVSVSFFYDNLDPYGEWVQDPDYGYCWHPTNVDENWAPYTDGYWAYTDQGWTWVSYEDYGGIVYHYGRWAHIPGEGWVWVPGTTWAPAWVSWRSNDDYVGWAPLPPEAHFRAGFGFGVGVDAQFDIGPGCYSFVHVGDFGEPALGGVILQRNQNTTIINNTTNITNITTNNSTVYTGGPSYSKIAAVSKRPIPTLKLVRQTNAAAIHGANGKILSHQQGNQLMVIAPHVTAPEGGKFPAPKKVAKTLTGVKADNGWAGQDPGQRAALESKFKSEGGSEKSAKPVNPEDLKVVTEKAKTTGPAKALETTEESTKPKAEKKKTPSISDLENAPATEESGAPTPKAEKKSHELENGGEGEKPEATPTPRKKAKKSPTPEFSDARDEDSGKPKQTDSNLHPFMGDGSNESRPKSGEEVSRDSGEPKGPAGGDEAAKSEKKKKKGEGEPTPPQ